MDGKRRSLTDWVFVVCLGLVGAIVLNLALDYARQQVRSMTMRNDAYQRCSQAQEVTPACEMIMKGR
jgi:formate/nitrite transporter FocA (FNT family)